MERAVHVPRALECAGRARGDGCIHRNVSIGEQRERRHSERLAEFIERPLEHGSRLELQQRHREDDRLPRRPDRGEAAELEAIRVRAVRGVVQDGVLGASFFYNYFTAFSLYYEFRRPMDPVIWP